MLVCEKRLARTIHDLACLNNNVHCCKFLCFPTCLWERLARTIHDLACLNDNVHCCKFLCFPTCLWKRLARTIHDIACLNNNVHCYNFLCFPTCLWKRLARTIHQQQCRPVMFKKGSWVGNTPVLVPARTLKQRYQCHHTCPSIPWKRLFGCLQVECLFICF